MSSADQFLFVLCFRSCLKSGDTRELYETLDLQSKKASLDEIKRAYKKASLNLHPDKLAQRGIEVTEEHKKQFLKVKEAYDILSDPKRRKLYDQVGLTGLKLIENPQQLNPIEVLKNFQNNKCGPMAVGILLLLLFSSLLILPILFSLKCDQTLGSSAPWTAIWTPMWVVDLFYFILAIRILGMKSSNPNDSNNRNHNGDNDEEEEQDATQTVNIPLTTKLYNFITIVLFILIQIFIMIRLDHDVKWSWFATFAPWFIYEFVIVCSLLPTAFFVTYKKPVPTASTESDIEAGGDDEEALLKKMTEEGEYFQNVMSQENDRFSVVVSILRVWQAIFFAVKLDGSVSWNWGLVLLPVWVYFCSGFIYAIILRLQAEIIQATLVAKMEENKALDPLDEIKVHELDMLQRTSTQKCCGQCIWLLMALLLVFRLTVSSYSTFIIIFPVFVGLGCCCCLSFCMLMSLSCVDTAELEKEMNNEKDGGSYRSPDDAVAKPEEAVVIISPGDKDGSSSSSNNGEGVAATATATTAAYGTFDPTGVVDHPSSSPSSPVPSADEHKSPQKNIPAVDHTEIEADFADIDD